MALSDNLKKIREERKITKKELCEKTGISERAYLTYEFGEREPKISVIEKLADFYGVTTDYLLGREPAVEVDIVDLVATTADFTELEKDFFGLYISYDREQRLKFLSDIFKKLKNTAKEINPDHATGASDN